MARLIYGLRALADIRRAVSKLEAVNAPEPALAALAAIRSAVEMLQYHPLVGREVAGDIRELVISFGRTGYVALYRYQLAANRVEVLSVKHQRELDYT